MCVCGFVLIFKTTTTNFSVTVSHIRSCAASSFCLLLTDSSDSSFNFTFVVLLYLTAQISLSSAATICQQVIESFCQS